MSDSLFVNTGVKSQQLSSKLRQEVAQKDYKSIKQFLVGEVLVYIQSIQQEQERKYQWNSINHAVEEALNSLNGNLVIGELINIVQVYYENLKILVSQNYTKQLIQKLCQEEYLNDRQKSFEDLKTLLDLISSLNMYQNQICTDFTKPLFFKGFLTLIAEHVLPSIPPESVNSSIWEDFIVKCIETYKNQMLLRNTLRKYSDQFSKQFPSYLEKLYDLYLSQLIRNQYKCEFLILALNQVSQYQLKVQGSVMRDVFLSFLNGELKFQQLIKVILKMKYALEPYSISKLLSKLIEMDKNFQIFCIIELFLNENNKSEMPFDFNEVTLSADELKYIVVQQNFFTKVLQSLNEKKDLSPDIDNLSNHEIMSVHSSFNKSEYSIMSKYIGGPEIKGDDYIMECMSLASSEHSDMSDFEFLGVEELELQKGEDIEKKQDF